MSAHMPEARSQHRFTASSVSGGLQAGRPVESRLDALQLDSSDREPPPKALSPMQLPDGKVAFAAAACCV